MPSPYRIRIERVDGQIVHLIPGGKAERDMVDAIVNRVRTKGVGFARTEAHVLADVRAAIGEVIHEMKSEIRPTR